MWYLIYYGHIVVTTTQTSTGFNGIMMEITLLIQFLHLRAIQCITVICIHIIRLNVDLEYFPKQYIYNVDTWILVERLDWYCWPMCRFGSLEAHFYSNGNRSVHSMFQLVWIWKTILTNRLRGFLSLFLHKFHFNCLVTRMKTNHILGKCLIPKRNTYFVFTWATHELTSYLLFQNIFITTVLECWQHEHEGEWISQQCENISWAFVIFSRHCFNCGKIIFFFCLFGQRQHKLIHYIIASQLNRYWILYYATSRQIQFFHQIRVWIHLQRYYFNYWIISANWIVNNREAVWIRRQRTQKMWRE